MAMAISRSDGSINRHIEILKALANPARFRIAWSLSRSDKTVKLLAERLGMKQSIVSQQLGVLRMSDIVQGAREKGFTRYRLIEPKVALLMRDLNEKQDCGADGARCNSAIKVER
jgi:DNA-binding transcriptional ArsR family regulator